MLAYILAVIFPLLVEGLYRKKLKILEPLISEREERKIRWRYIFLSALPMFFLIAFRNQSIGTDTGMYINHFKRTVNTPWSKIFDVSTMEKGYLVFVKLITVITEKPLVFQIIYTSIYLLAVTSYVNQQEDNHFFTLFLFGTLGMYMFMFTGVRQCLAISICLFSYQFIKKRKVIPFAILMLLAYQFHKSSILFISAYLIYPRKLSIWNTLIYGVLMVLAVIFLDVIQEWFNDQLDYEYGIQSGAGGYIFTALYFAMTLFTIYAVCFQKEVSKSIQGSINIGIIATIFWVLRAFTRVAERPSYYFLMCVFTSFAYAISTLGNQREREGVKFAIIFFALAVFVYRLIGNVNFVPYMFYKF